MKKIAEIFNSFVRMIGSISLYLTAWAIPVYFLWNLVVPDIFGIDKITYLQSIGVIALLILLNSVTVFKKTKI